MFDAAAPQLLSRKTDGINCKLFKLLSRSGCAGYELL